MGGSGTESGVTSALTTLTGIHISLRKTKPGAADVYFFSFFFSLWNFNGISNQPATGCVVH